MGNEIKKYPIPLIFKKIFKDKLSGELKITSDIKEGFTKRLFFNKGLLDFASTTVRKERLGQILFDKGKISEEVLLKVNVMKSQEKIHERIGRILTKLTSLNEEDISYTILYQVKKIASNTFSLNDGEWAFLKTTPRIPNSKRLKLKLPILIREGVKNTEDFSFYKNKFKNCSPITTTLPDSIRSHLSSEEVDIFMLLSNGSEEMLKDLIAESSYDDKVMWEAIIIFYLMNILAISTLNPVFENLNQLKYEINELYEKIQNNSISFYEILGIDHNTKHEDRKEKYLSLISKYHPDKLSVVSNPVFDEKIDQVVATINTAYQVVCDKKRKETYDEKGRNLLEVEEETEARDEKLMARKMFRKATRLYQDKLFNDSIYLIEKALAYDSSRADYYMLLAQNQCQIPILKRKAEKNFKRAAELEPWNPNPFYALGLMFKKESFYKKAEACFKKALEVDMEHTLASKSLKEMKSGKKLQFNMSMFKKK